MALIMLAIGGLLTLVGVYAIATGLPVIEIERGWSMVISGSVLLSGGFIVAALGIVVRTLNGLKGDVVPQPAALSPSIAPIAQDEPAVATSAFAVRPPEPVPAMTASVPAFTVAAPATVPGAGAGYAAAHRQAMHGAPEPQEAAAEPFHEPEPEVDEPPAHAPASEAAPAHEPIDHQPADHQPADHEPAGHEPAGHEPTDDVVADHAVADTPSHDWLDKEFAAFDLDAPHGTAPPRTPEPPHAQPPHVPEPSAPEHHEESLPSAHAPEPPMPEPVAVHQPEPAAEPKPRSVAEAPSTAPEAQDGNLAVIGRYDSDGTSYVMYSDGSIEAQSESGVFRFSSMAELKAFIEG